MHHVWSDYAKHTFYMIKKCFGYLSLQVEIAPDDLTNLILCVFLLQ